MSKNILVTGGAGFIGSHVIRRLVKKYTSYHVVNLDALTYAGNLKNLIDIETLSNYTFIKGNINDRNLVNQIFEQFNINTVIHLAAESHVDRSIQDPMAFVETNVLGTANLLHTAYKHWHTAMQEKLFYHISTDEVFGSLGQDGLFTEKTAYDPRSPYSASKAAADHLVRSFYHTYQLPVVISNCSNNYGPYHFPEKLIPLAIHRIIHMQEIPVYGKGENIRDWLYVEDHAAAIDLIMHNGNIGESYNIGGHNEWKNIDLIHYLCKIMDEKLQRLPGTSAELIKFVTDRPGHDARYAIEAKKIYQSLGWKPSVTFEEGLIKTVDWYLANSTWLQEVTNGDYLQYYEQQYAHREHMVNKNNI